LGRLANIIALRMIRALVRLGWTLDRTSGSHHVLVKDGHRPLTIPVHQGRALKEPLARAILKQAGVSEDEFFDAY
jgi:predicted RNA binding protein YcfA (HicA-like mRNA interferase family)